MVGELKGFPMFRDIGLHAEDLADDRGLGPKDAANIVIFCVCTAIPLSGLGRPSAGGGGAALLGLLTGWLGGKGCFFRSLGCLIEFWRECSGI